MKGHRAFERRRVQWPKTGGGGTACRQQKQRRTGRVKVAAPSSGGQQSAEGRQLGKSSDGCPWLLRAMGTTVSACTRGREEERGSSRGP